MNAADLITDAMVEAASEALHEESCPRSLRGAVDTLEVVQGLAKKHRDFVTKRGRDDCVCTICDMCRAIESALRGESLAVAPKPRGESIDAAHIDRQRGWSAATFGPGPRLNAILDHIGKEMREIAAQPLDLFEWVDVIILALDGAWRAGWESQQIIDAIREKQAHNEARSWPDWRTSDPDRAIEHIHEATP